MSAVADKLREAKALIERGWCTRVASMPIYINGKSSMLYCSEGALRAVGAMNDAGPLLRATIGTAAIHAWNDAPGRKGSEVLAAFDKAIELAEREPA